MWSVRPNLLYRLYICVTHIYKILPVIYYFTNIEIVFLVIFFYQFILAIAINIYLKKYISDNKKNIQNIKNIKFITATYNNKIVGFFSIQKISTDKLWSSYLFILPQYHRKGIGTLFANYLYEYGEKHNYNGFSFGTSTLLNNQIKMIKRFTENNEYKLIRTVDYKWYAPINKVHCSVYK